MASADLKQAKRKKGMTSGFSQKRLRERNKCNAQETVTWAGETGIAKGFGTATAPGVSHAQGGGPVAFEVFAGSGHLSNALETVGMRSFRFDILLDPSHDMSQKDCVVHILKLAKSLRCQYVYLAPPCNTYSAARYPKIRTAVCLSQ